ncbi:endocuticle structural glycoprotein ABD-5-like [Haematobia irritans]|uniref:endocuticle structural glycoprotein ABD-5-like n=1 Tax=Haematobia irritans TaxID=7368 RepID=UPI003F4F6081
MLKYICLLALVSCVFAAAIDSTTEKREIIPLLKYDRVNNPDGSFNFVYEGGDKSFREETAQVINSGTEEEALEVSGSYRYIDEEGREIEVHYTAGKNGFVPIGTNIFSEISEAAKLAAEAANAQDEEEKKEKRN